MYLNQFSEQLLPSAPVWEENIAYNLSDVVYPQMNFIGQRSAQVLPYQAYSNVYQDVISVYNLPNPNLDDKSIQTLQQIEERSKTGVISELLTLMIKVLQVVQKLTLGFAIGISVTLILSALFGSPAAVILLSTFIAFPIIGNLVLGSLICKLAAYVLGRVRQKWIEHSFHLAIREENYSLHVLKTWTQLKDLSEIKQRFRKAVEQIFLDQQRCGFDDLLNQQICCLNSLIGKIDCFHALQMKLGMPQPARLLNHYLSA